MICKLRLNKRRDLDLLWLYYHDKDFYKKIVNILNDYSNGKKPLYKIDNIKPTDRSETITSNVYLNLSIKDTYTNIIDMLSRIKNRHRCDFIKNLIKCALQYPVLDGYFSDEYAISDIVTDVTTDVVTEENVDTNTTIVSTDNDNNNIVANKDVQTSTENTDEADNNSFDIFDSLMQNYR